MILTYYSSFIPSRINSNLANDIGNLAQRVFTLIAKHCDGKVPAPEGALLQADEELLNAAEHALVQCKEFMAKQSLHRMCKAVIEVATLGNKYIGMLQ